MVKRSARAIPIATPSLGEEEWQALREPIESGWLTQGPKVAAFEQEFATRHGVSAAVATTSCTTALHLGLLALGIGPGDEVIVPAFTWIATANAVLYCGATPVFVDVCPGTYNIDCEAAAAQASLRTKAVIAVHLFGLCADMNALRAALPEHVRIVEDAACAAGARYNGRSAGGLGDVACFSFHPRKSITTGEGGMITTDDTACADLCRQLRDHGATVSDEVRHYGPKPYLLPEFDVLGFNYRLTDLQGAIGLVQLRKLDGFIAERDRWARWYRDALAGINWLAMPELPPGYQHAWQAFVTTVVGKDAAARRNEVMERLAAAGISTRPGTHAVTELSYYRELLGLKPGAFAVASRLADCSMALPLHNRMSEEDYAYVAETIRAL